LAISTEETGMHVNQSKDTFSTLQFQLSLLRLSSALEKKLGSEEAEDRKLEVLLRQQMSIDPA
jgi:hypothetical protein